VDVAIAVAVEIVWDEIDEFTDDPFGYFFD
jgi:hypothetical protein